MDTAGNEALVLEARAARLRRYRAAAQEEGQHWLAEFPLGSRRCAVDLDCLLACRPLKGVVPVPLAPPELLGVFRHQGRFVPAFSLAALMGLEGWHRDPGVLVVLQLGESLAAFDCEEVPRMRSVPLSKAGQARAAVSSIFLEGEQALNLIDPSRLFGSFLQEASLAPG
jgi:chemotaxis signal transduction protein